MRSSWDEASPSVRIEVVSAILMSLERLTFVYKTCSFAVDFGSLSIRKRNDKKAHDPSRLSVFIDAVDGFCSIWKESGDLGKDNLELLSVGSL